MSEMRLGNAPVSYGVFGDLDVDSATTPAHLLTTMAAGGYAGSELGPPGFFGGVQGAVEAFTASGLVGIGTYVPLHTQDGGAVLARDLERMHQSIAEVAAVNPAGLIILADEGSATLLEHPCHDRALGLDDSGWSRLADVVGAAAAEVADAGLSASFHPHVSTYVESPEEIERLLDLVDINLTYDVAHVVMGGGDAAEHLRRWWGRINHVHAKDVDLAVLRQAVNSGRTDFDVWWARLCTRLGDGDVDLPAFTTALRDLGYQGWVVVEQDSAPLTTANLSQVLADQDHNIAWLREHLR
ncbi:MAG: TIM barrel protein [Nostocoides sp.]